jgi:hypothetical protein
MEKCNTKKEKMSIGRMLLNVCPYTHLWGVIKTSVKERQFPAAARPGLLIFLLGLCCPIFWVALFSGASGAELKFHATHSAIVAGIGLVIMISGIIKK